MAPHGPSSNHFLWHDLYAARFEAFGPVRNVCFYPKEIIMPASILRHALAALFVVVGLSGRAQSTAVRTAIGLQASGFVYQGDLTPAPLGSYKSLRPGLALWVERQAFPRVSLRAQLLLGSISASDGSYATPAWRRQRDLAFHTSISELALLALWDVGGGRSAFSPYVFTGAGLAMVRVHRDASGFQAAWFAGDKATIEGLAADMAQGPPRALPVVPLGAGLRYMLSPAWSLHVETAYRLTSTDYLDGFSRVANPLRNDHYQSLSISLRFRPGQTGRFGCPVMRQ
ncbi:MAG: thrombospondin type 3 repeat-containing protein [Flaviaesturariibacter sp.]|nr:thrombospondin type 3 repeat-containing protein [Flaviaesturariibacter sp.]